MQKKGRAGIEFRQKKRVAAKKIAKKNLLKRRAFEAFKSEWNALRRGENWAIRAVGTIFTAQEIDEIAQAIFRLEQIETMNPKARAPIGWHEAELKKYRALGLQRLKEYFENR